MSKLWDAIKQVERERALARQSGTRVRGDLDATVFEPDAAGDGEGVEPQGRNTIGGS